MIIDELSSLSPAELDYVCDYIFKLVKEKITDATSNDENYKERPCNCPHCKSERIIKYGFNNGRQKYLCKDCKKLFSNTTKTLFHSSRSSYSTWKTFIKCELNGLTLEKESIEIGKSITTCFNMRHKLYQAIKDSTKVTLNGLVEIDAQYTKINLKGTKKDNMPREFKKRGKTSAFSGISNHKVCLVTAIDEFDNILFQVAGLGPESLDKYMKYKDYFSSDCTFVSDSKSCIKNFAKEIDCKIEQIPVIANKKRYKTDNGHSVSSVNEIHTEFSTLISKRHGVSTRHLQDYLNWLIFIKKLRYTVEARVLASSAYIEILKYRHSIKRSDICKIAMPIDLKAAYGSYHYGCFA